jgi:CRP/FNR family transcriptional regulator, cyclic AMP receptor protein
MDLSAELGISPSPLSSALSGIFKGRLCDVLLHNRAATTHGKGEVIYDLGDEKQTLFFIRSGFIKVGTITEDGHELIYDVRKGGDIVGELCASGQPRQDRAIALEQVEIIPVPLDDVLDVIQKNREVLRQIVQVFCNSLSDAYDQLNSLAFDDIVHRLVRVLLKLGGQIGRTSERGTEISAYLTQEEISQMVAVRRERVSTAMNFLRNRGMIDYSNRGYLVLDLKALENYCG